MSKEDMVELEGVGEPGHEALGHRARDVDPQQLPLGRLGGQGLVELEHLVPAVRAEAAGADPGGAVVAYVARAAILLVHGRMARVEVLRRG